jgi:hypothetical protein
MNKKLYQVVLLVALNQFGFAGAAEPIYAKKIAFNSADIHSKEKIRVMLHTSKFSIYPKFNQGAIYLQTPALQGVDPISSLVGTFIAVTMINEANKADRDSAVAFNHHLDDALKTININDEIQKSVAAELAKIGFFDDTQFEIIDNINGLGQAGLIVRIEEKYTLTLASRLYFDSQLKSLCIETSSKIWQKNQTKPIHYSELIYRSEYLNASGKVELQNKWTQNNGELLATKIKEGIQEITGLLANELANKKWGELENTKPLEIETINVYDGKKTKTPFYVLNETPDRLIGRVHSFDSANILSLPKTSVLSSHDLNQLLNGP